MRYYKKYYIHAHIKCHILIAHQISLNDVFSWKIFQAKVLERKDKKIRILATLQV